VVLRREEHLLDQAPVLLLHVGAIRQGGSAAPHTVGQVVAQFLELPERKQSGARPAGHPPLEALAGPGRAEEGRELGLEALDLIEQ
jgi:hypothetical protein